MEVLQNSDKDEKIIIEGSGKQIANRIFRIGILLAGIAFVGAVIFILAEFFGLKADWEENHIWYKNMKKYDTGEEYAWWNVSDRLFLLVALPAGVMLIFTVIYAFLGCMKIVVTDRRIYGKTYFGKSIDLPLDSVSAIGSKWMKGISVATSSGKISFLLIKNSQEIHKVMRELLIDRQNKKQIQEVVVSNNISGADELLKYSELLEKGIITQEDFDAKKKQILGL